MAEPDTSAKRRRKAEEDELIAKRPKRDFVPGDLGMIVDIIVGSGDSQKTFAMHSSLLRRRSAYFRTARISIGGDKSLTIRLPEQNPKAFEPYAKSLYGYDQKEDLGSLIRKLSKAGGQIYPVSVRFSIARMKFARILVECWRLGAFMKDPAFCSEAMDVLLKTKIFQNGDNVDLVASEGSGSAVPQGSSLYRLAVDRLAASLTPEDYRMKSGEWTPGFKDDLLVAMLESRPTNLELPGIGDRAKYQPDVQDF